MEAKEIGQYLISSFSKEISLDKFYNFLKSQNVSLSKKTLYNYLDYFESSLFSFSKNIQDQREAQEGLFA